MHKQLEHSWHLHSLTFSLLIAAFASGAGPIVTALGVEPDDDAPAAEISPAHSENVITGRVTNKSGQPITNATIEWGRDDTSFKNRQQVTTDANGDYSITLNSLDGRCSLAASAPEYSATNEGVTGGRQSINFVLSPSPDGNFVAGKVTDEQGVPIADVRVEAFTPVTGVYSSFSMPTGRNYFTGPDRVTHTDAQGRFRIVDVPPRTSAIESSFAAPTCKRQQLPHRR